MPQNKDWWYTRCASLIRKVYIHGPIGVSELRSEYGGRKQIGYNLAHHRDAGGAIIRKALQQLQQAGYIVNKRRGRSISEEGMKKVDRIATELYDEIIKNSPGLQRYA
jgi:small subunit ribosomal protein S19e